MSEEKRAHERTVVRYPAQISVGDAEVISGTVENLGALGALVSTAELEPHLDVGTRLQLAIMLSGSAPIEVAGQVQRVDQEFAHGEIRRTFAVLFDDEIEV